MPLIHMIIYFIYYKNFESWILVSSMSTVWDDIDGFSKQYRCALTIYLMTVLSSSYDIIIHHAINAPVHENNLVYGINATDKYYLKE